MIEPRRFVLLEHRWQGVHYDLMLEVDGVLKTWKLAEPLQPGPQPAEASFDHRLFYLDYEGPIGGNRGEVRRVDSGTYRGAVTATSVEACLSGAVLAGMLQIGMTEGGWVANFDPCAPRPQDGHSS
jgi:hypothetical protein